MGWEIGYDANHERDVGYGVPSVCDHPECNAVIHRGLSYVCGGEPCGGADGCGLFFCGDHKYYISAVVINKVCARCKVGQPHYPLKPDPLEWVQHKLFDASWALWRCENKAAVKTMVTELAEYGQDEKAAASRSEMPPRR